jgi:hypothetical protein
MARRRDGEMPNQSTIDFVGMVQHGGDEFTAQTCNGTAKWRGTGWNRERETPAEPQVRPKALSPWLPGNSNRTGE